MLGQRAVIALSVAVGIALELGVHAVSGRREAWDSELFWTLGLPLAMLASTIVGALSRGREWIWTLLVSPAQVATMMVRSAEISGLFPLTLVLSTVLSTPFLFAAFIGSLLRRSDTTAG